MTMVYVAIVRTFVNQDLTRILGNICSQIESLGWNSLDRDTVDAPSLNCCKKDWIKLDAQRWVSSRLVMWVDLKTRLHKVRSTRQGKHVTNNKTRRSTFCTTEANYWQTRSIALPLCDSRTSCWLRPDALAEVCQKTTCSSVLLILVF